MRLLSLSLARCFRLTGAAVYELPVSSDTTTSRLDELSFREDDMPTTAVCAGPGQDSHAHCASQGETTCLDFSGVRAATALSLLQSLELPPGSAPPLDRQLPVHKGEPTRRSSPLFKLTAAHTQQVVHSPAGVAIPAGAAFPVFHPPPPARLGD